jgi:5-methylcytosine-specific restriction endonuclease McrA
MTKGFKEHGGFSFVLPKELDKSMLKELDATSDMPRGHIVDLIKEHLCRRGKNCALCNKSFNRRDLQIDRRRPTSQGGGDSMDNLQLLCKNCAMLKGSKSMLEARKKQRLEKNAPKARFKMVKRCDR